MGSLIGATGWDGAVGPVDCDHNTVVISATDDTYRNDYYSPLWINYNKLNIIIACSKTPPSDKKKRSSPAIGIGQSLSTSTTIMYC